MEIVDNISDEELENIEKVSSMDIDDYDDDCEEKDISLKDQNYTHLEAMEFMDVMRSYMTENAFPLENLKILDKLRWASQQQRFKGKNKYFSIYDLFQLCVRIFYPKVKRVCLLSDRRPFHACFPCKSHTSHLHFNCCSDSIGTKYMHYI